AYRSECIRDLRWTPLRFIWALAYRSIDSIRRLVSFVKAGTFVLRSSENFSRARAREIGGGDEPGRSKRARGSAESADDDHLCEVDRFAPRPGVLSPISTYSTWSHQKKSHDADGADGRAIPGLRISDARKKDSVLRMPTTAR
ncbi:hypothetical protein THAOC_30315, partial [Thalassiosira oceanica]